MDILANIITTFVINFQFCFDMLIDIGDYNSKVEGWRWLQSLKTTLENLVINQLMPATAGVGLAIAVVFFLISVIGLVTEDRFTPEFLVKFFAKLAIAIAVILWSDSILKAMIEFGDAFGNMFSNITNNVNLGVNGVSAGNAYNDYVSSVIAHVSTATGYTFEGNINPFEGKWKKTGGGDAVGLIYCIGMALSMNFSSGLIIMFSCILIPALQGSIMFVQLSRYIELYARGAFLPIAGAVMSDDGWKGAGGRYFKKLFALCTQSAAISLSCVIISVCEQAYLADALVEATGSASGPIAIVGVGPKVILMGGIIAIAGIAFMFKSLNLMNDLWGA